MKRSFVLLLLFLSAALVAVTSAIGQDKAPVRVGVVGLVHDHVHGILNRLNKPGDVVIVGIAESDKEAVKRLSERYKIAPELLHDSLEVMLEEIELDAVMAFTNTFDHKHVVEVCAPRGVHVMMEKPLAVSMEHANIMTAVAKQHNVRLMVNYETTWYRSNHEAYAIVHDKKLIGDVRKVVVHDGHEGPREIGCSETFLSWLTDPVLNGGGALTDFGCYGANLMTWLMKNERPKTVTAVTQQIKPDVYPKVDDEATIILTYPNAQAVIQASWNWPFNRKDMEVYGKTGYAHTVEDYGVRLKKDSAPASLVRPPALEGPHHDFVAYLAAVVRGEMEPQGLSSLENNLIVTEILDAARESAKTGQAVLLK